MKDSAHSVSYAQTVRLNNHTDQSVPAHGIPALLLVVNGFGVRRLRLGLGCLRGPALHQGPSLNIRLSLGERYMVCGFLPSFAPISVGLFELAAHA